MELDPLTLIRWVGGSSMVSGSLGPGSADSLGIERVLAAGECVFSCAR